MSKCGDAQTHAHIRATLVESGIIREIRAWFHQALGRARILTCFRLFKPVKVDSVCVCVFVFAFVFVCVCGLARCVCVCVCDISRHIGTLLASVQESRRFLAV